MKIYHKVAGVDCLSVATKKRADIADRELPYRLWMNANNKDGELQYALTREGYLVPVQAPKEEVGL